MRLLAPTLALLFPLVAFASAGSAHASTPQATAPQSSLAVASATAAPIAAASAEHGAYHLDTAKSKIYARLYKTGMAGAFAHNHVIEARKVTGTATLDPRDLAHSSVQIDVSVLGLYPDSDAMRAMLKLPRTLSDRERDEITDHLRSKVQLWADHYDKITFRSTKIESKGEDTWQVTGAFTLRGVTHTISLPMHVTDEGEGYHAKGQFRILQSQYGYQPYSALLGAIQNQDPADIVIDAYLVPG